MLYQHRQNGKVMEIVKQDEKRGTLIIRFTDGTTGAITSGTFKRWYKEFEVPETVEVEDYEGKSTLTEDEMLEQAVVDPDSRYTKEQELKVAAYEAVTDLDSIPDNEYVSQVMEQKKELGIECPPIDHIEIVDSTCADGTPYAEIGKEIAQQAKEKAKKAAVTHEKGSKSHSSKKNDVTTSETLETRVKQLQDVLTALGYEVKVGTDKKLIAKATGKRTMNFYVGLRKAVLGFAKDNVPEGMVADRVRNCAISHSFDIQYDNLETLKKFM